MKATLSVLSFLFLSAITHAATISWNSGQITSASDVVNSGETVFAFTCGKINADEAKPDHAPAVTVNGIKFENASAGGSYISSKTFTYSESGAKWTLRGEAQFQNANNGASMDGGFLPEGDYKTLLQTGFTASNKTGVLSFDLIGLMTGHTYVCQIWISQANETYGSKPITFVNGSDSTDTGSISASRGGSDTKELGDWVTATFVADESGTQTISTSGNIDYMKINAVQLRDLGMIPESSTATLGLIALAALGMRRKRA